MHFEGVDFLSLLKVEVLLWACISRKILFMGTRGSSFGLGSTMTLNSSGSLCLKTVWKNGESCVGWEEEISSVGNSVKGCCHFGRRLLIKSLQPSISQMNHAEGSLGQGVFCPAWISSVTRTLFLWAVTFHFQEARGAKAHSSTCWWPFQSHVEAGLGAILAALLAWVKSAQSVY